LVFTKIFNNFFRGLLVELNENKKIKSVKVIEDVPMVDVKYPYLKLKKSKDGITDCLLVNCDYHSIAYQYNFI
jgi:hypothetical protein